MSPDQKKYQEELEVIETPLVEATVEIRFPGDARIEAIRGTFQQQFRADYPLLLVPAAIPGHPPALQHYRFSNETQTSSVALAINSISVSTRQYPGWAEFKDRVLVMWRWLAERISPEKLSRVGVRFVNQFSSFESSPIAKSDGPGYISALREFPTEYSFRAVLRHDVGGFKRIEVQLDKATSQILVDLDWFAIDVAPAVLPSLLDDLHEALESEFWKMLDPAFVSRLRQEA